MPCNLNFDLKIALENWPKPTRPPQKNQNSSVLVHFKLKIHKTKAFFQKVLVNFSKVLVKFSVFLSILQRFGQCFQASGHFFQDFGLFFKCLKKWPNIWEFDKNLWQISQNLELFYFGWQSKKVQVFKFGGSRDLYYPLVVDKNACKSSAPIYDLPWTKYN